MTVEDEREGDALPPYKGRPGAKGRPWNQDEDEYLLAHAQRFGARAVSVALGRGPHGGAEHLAWLNARRPDLVAKHRAPSDADPSDMTGEEFARLRREAHHTWDTLARAWRRPRSTIRQYEAGRTRVPRGYAVWLSEVAARARRHPPPEPSPGAKMVKADGAKYGRMLETLGLSVRDVVDLAGQNLAVLNYGRRHGFSLPAPLARWLREEAAWKAAHPPPLIEPRPVLSAARRAHWRRKRQETAEAAGA